MDAELLDRTQRHSSLRWRLLTLVSITAVVVMVLAGSLSYRQAKREVQELMDGEMAKMAALMLVQAQQGNDHLAEMPTQLARLRGLKDQHIELPLEFQIGSPDGTILVRSPDAPTVPISGKLGFATIEYYGEPLRSLVLETGDQKFRIQVMQSITTQNEEALEMAAKSVQPLFLLLPLLLLAIYFSVRGGLKPLDNLATEVLSRSAENLSPLAGRTAPRETQPLVAAINRLLFRLNGSLENERRFTADAAHELRTPLAAARVQTQVAMLSTDADKRNHALAQTLAGLDRATRLVEQMLRLARLDPLAALPDPTVVDLSQLTRDVVAGTLDSTRKCAIDVDIDDERITVDGVTDLLQVALRNLVDNAVRYSPEGSLITVALYRENGLPVLSVADNGPGVSETELPRLAERFYRSPEVVAEGSGLGLTIVHRIAELHGARLELANRASGGLEARLCWNAKENGVT